MIKRLRTAVKNVESYLDSHYVHIVHRLLVCRQNKDVYVQMELYTKKHFHNELMIFLARIFFYIMISCFIHITLAHIVMLFPVKMLL